MLPSHRAHHADAGPTTPLPEFSPESVADSAAKCAFVSFIRPEVRGQMVQALQARGITAPQHKFDPQRPDLGKLESLLGSIMLDATATDTPQALRDEQSEE